MNILLYLTIIGSIFTLLLTGLKAFFIKRYGGSWYYYIWILILISFCLPYKFDISQYFQPKHENSQQSTRIFEFMSPENDVFLNLAENNYLKMQNNTISDNVLKTTKYFGMFSLERILYVGYFVGFFTLVMYYSLSYFAFKKKLKSTTRLVLNERYLNCMSKVCYTMGITKNITLKESCLIASPMLIGILKPIIILPIQDFNEIDLSMVFKHELTHYKRHDIIYKLLALLVTIVHWFNPISYLSLHNITEACEYSCDEAVTKKMGEESKRKYGYMLLNQIKANSKDSLFLSGFAKDNKNIKFLERRFLIIMNNKKYKCVRITLVSILALVLCTNLFDLKLVNAGSITENGELSDAKYSALTETNAPNIKDEPLISAATLTEYFAETLTQEELHAIYQYVDNSKNNADIGTRSIMDSEHDRIKILQEQYMQDGLRPKKALPLSVGDYDFFFDLDNEMYNYPNRELTDDEILQLIDWRLKVNYALSLRYTQSTSIKPGVEDINETEAIELAIKSIEKIFDVDTTTMQVVSSYNKNGSVQPDGWFIQLYSSYKADMFRSNDEAYSDWNYGVWIYSLGDINIARSSPTYKSSAINLAEKDMVSNDMSWVEKAISIIVENQGEIHKIENAYFIDESNNWELGIVDIRVDLEDSSSYTISLFYPDQSLKGLMFTPENKIHN